MLIISENSRVKHAILYIRLKMKGIHCSKYKLKDSTTFLSLRRCVVSFRETNSKETRLEFTVC